MSRMLHSVYPNMVRAAAAALLGRVRGEEWLASPNPRLGGVAPMLLAGDRCGAERVIAEVCRVSHGKARR